MSSPIQNKSASQVEQKLERWLAPVRDNEVWLEDAMGDSQATTQTRRAAHIDKLGELIRQVPSEKAKLRRRSQWIWGVSAAAALLVAVMGSMLAQSQALSPSQTVATGDDAHLRQFFGQVVARREAGATEVLKPGAALFRGDELSTTAEAYASLDIGRTRIDMASATTVELVRTEVRDQAYKLRAGRVDVSVPKAPGEHRSLVVMTPDATVRVRGTVFSVEVEGERGASLTRVQVTRGSVSVEHEGKSRTLHAGDRWNSQLSPLPPLPPEPSALRNEAAPKQTPSTSTSTSTSSLADQNQLFAKALSAQRRGNHALAAHLYSRLLKRYPDSPLGQTARSELTEIKRQLTKQESSEAEAE